MKKFTLILAGVCLALGSFGQVAKQGVSAPDKDQSVNVLTTINPIKGSGDVFWSTSFNWGNVETGEWVPPTGWSVVDEADLGNFWMWRSPYDTIGGCCTWNGPASYFETPLDGYMVVPADEYNSRDGVTTAVSMNTHFTTPPIDCSSKSSVVVKVWQAFRLCCNENFELLLQVTNDGGVHWAQYDLRHGVGANNVVPVKYRAVEVNISDVAAGLPAVQIRFLMRGPMYYYWMLDDLKLCEAYQNNLVLEDYWADFSYGDKGNIGNINYWPLSQMGMDDGAGGTIGSYTFRGAMLNMGMADQEGHKLNLQVLRNNAEIWNQDAVATDLWSLERDTQQISNPFLADNYGVHKFNYTATSENEEEVPVNNTASMLFTVTDSLFFRCDRSAEASSGGGGWVGGDNAGDMVGVGYDIPANCEINYLYAYLGGINMSQTPQFQFNLYKDLGEEGYAEIINTDVIDATADMAWTWQCLPVMKDGESEFLTPGFYIACVTMWGYVEGDDNGVNGMGVGWDKDTKWSGSYSFLYRISAGEWWSIDKLNMIGIVISESGGPKTAPVTFNVDLNAHIANNEFHPGTDLVDVVGFTSVWMGPAAMTDPDSDGIYSVTVDGFPIGQAIEFKYRVNGVEEAYPTTGNLHRNYSPITYWNEINSRFNNGVTTGIGNRELTDSFNVYPNPTTGSFTVSFSSVVPVNAEISLLNMQGQVVYNHTVADVTSHTETINDPLAKGVYFLRLNNGNEVTVRKVVVQ